MERKAAIGNSKSCGASSAVESPGLATGPHNAWVAWPQPSWPALLTLGLLTRVAVLMWGVHCAHSGPPPGLIRDESAVATGNVGYNSRHLNALAAPGRKWVKPWYRWDAIWYAEISAFGYVFDPRAQSSTGFLPLLPMVMAAAARLGLDRYWAGLLVPNLAFAVGLAAFGKAALRVTGDRGTTWRACLLAVAYPYSFFFSAPYQESLGFALTAAAILAWLARRPIAAAAYLAWASLARLTTLAMTLGLVAEWFDDLAHRRPARHSAWLVALFERSRLRLVLCLSGPAPGRAFCPSTGAHRVAPAVRKRSEYLRRTRSTDRGGGPDAAVRGRCTGHPDLDVPAAPPRRIRTAPGLGLGRDPRPTVRAAPPAASIERSGRSPCPGPDHFPGPGGTGTRPGGQGTLLGALGRG